jgi:hypothetical protein
LLMRTRFAVWAASALFLHGGIAGLDPQWPTADAAALIEPKEREPRSPSLLNAHDAQFANAAGISPLTIGERIRQIPICIVWRDAWAGELGETLLFRVHEISGTTVSVGYFAYWSTERPWGNNALTRWFVPALAIDAFYSHLLFVLPGLQRLLYGAGDVEGVRIKYELNATKNLVPVSIVADNEQHREEVIDVSEAVDGGGRILLFDAVWSHQLGGHHAVTLARAGAQRRCYERRTLQQLTDTVAAAFRLGHRGDPLRADPAWAHHDTP